MCGTKKKIFATKKSLWAPARRRAGAAARAPRAAAARLRRQKILFISHETNKVSVLHLRLLSSCWSQIGRRAGPTPTLWKFRTLWKIIDFVENSRRLQVTNISEYMGIQCDNCICLFLNDSKLLLYHMPLCRDKQ